MVKYSRVSYGLRCQIEAFLQTKISVKDMATLLGLHKTTIYREIKRNNFGENYTAALAQQNSIKNFSYCRRKKLINEELGQAVEAKLALGWSPEQISGRFKRERIGHFCHQTIYKYISDNQPLRGFLRRYGKRGGGGRHIQRKILQNESRLSIDKRSKIVNERKRIGDWERDLFYAGNKKLLLVCTDRKSRLSKITKIERGTGVIVQKETIRLLQNAGGKLFTVTNDNGPEFKQNLPIGVPVYFCKPQKPHQRGTIENTIGLLRQYITRQTDIDCYDHKDIDEIENLINFRPRKCLDYKTPYEVYYNKKVALGL